MRRVMIAVSSLVVFSTACYALPDGVNSASISEIQSFCQPGVTENSHSNDSLFTQQNMFLSLVILLTCTVIFYAHQLRYCRAKLKKTTKNLQDCTQKLQNIGQTDVLTGAKTRHQFFVELTNKRFALSPYVVVVLGIDRLKMINDKYGQDIGDLALKHLANQLKWKLDNQFYARLCGGEFAILFDDSNKQQANQQLFKLKKHFIENPLYVDQQAIAIEISFGSACYPYDGSQGEDLVRLAVKEMRNKRELAEKEYLQREELDQLTEEFSL